MTSSESALRPEAGLEDAPRVAVIGCGLIGTALAMAAERTGCEVRGFDTDATTLEASALRSGLIAATSVADAIVGADVVFLCTPIPAIAEVARHVAEIAPGGPIVSDVGSVKAPIVEQLAPDAAEGSLRFIGGHLMAGSERSGPDAASPSLLDGAVWVLTPTPASADDDVALLRSIIERVGARPVEMTPEQHDRVVAVVSHLPQVVSTALMNLAATEDDGRPETLLLAAGGFRDLTRLAASNPALWAGILELNRRELTRAIDLFVTELSRIRDLVAAEDAEGVEQALADGKAERLQLSAKPQVRAGVAVLQILVPDQPGVFANLTAAMGEREVNIEDMQVVHAPEGGRGSVQLIVAAERAEDAIAALQAHGFDAVRIA